MKTKHFILSFLSGAVLLLCYACTPRATYYPDKVSIAIDSCDQFFSKHPLPYEAPLERKLQVLNNYSKLTLGMDKSEVLLIFGKPDFWYYPYIRGAFGNVAIINPQGSPVLWVWSYIFVMINEDFDDTVKNKYIDIYFAENKKLVRTITNIEGFQEIRDTAVKK